MGMQMQEVVTMEGGGQDDGQHYAGGDWSQHGSDGMVVLMVN